MSELIQYFLIFYALGLAITTYKYSVDVEINEAVNGLFERAGLFGTVLFLAVTALFQPFWLAAKVIQTIFSL